MSRTPTVRITEEEYADLKPFEEDPDAYGKIFKEIVGNAIWTKVHRAPWNLVVLEGEGYLQPKDRIIYESVADGKNAEDTGAAEASQDGR